MSTDMSLSSIACARFNFPLCIVPQLRYIISMTRDTLVLTFVINEENDLFCQSFRDVPSGLVSGGVVM